MSSNTTFDAFIPIITMLGVGLLIYIVTQLLTRVVAPRGKKQGNYNQAYECGEDPVGEAWSMFNVRFYVVGLIFIIFDVEAVLMFPIASIFKKMTEMGHGAYILVEFLIFIFILVSGLAYCWSKGDLDWVRSYRVKNREMDK